MHGTFGGGGGEEEYLPIWVMSITLALFGIIYGKRQWEWRTNEMDAQMLCEEHEEGWKKLVWWGCWESRKWLEAGSETSGAKIGAADPRSDDCLALHR